jgi:hypothetical protein
MCYYVLVHFPRTRYILFQIPFLTYFHVSESGKYLYSWLGSLQGFGYSNLFYFFLLPSLRTLWLLEVVLVTTLLLFTKLLPDYFLEFSGPYYHIYFYMYLFRSQQDEGKDRVYCVRTGSLGLQLEERGSERESRETERLGKERDRREGVS